MASKAGGEPNAGGMKDGRSSQMGRRHDGEATSVPTPDTIDGNYPVRRKTPADSLADNHWIKPKSGDPTKTIKP